MNGFKVEAVIFDFDGTICDSLKIKEEIFGELYLSYGEKLKKRLWNSTRKLRNIKGNKLFIFKNIVRRLFEKNYN